MSSFVRAAAGGQVQHGLGQRAAATALGASWISVAPQPHKAALPAHGRCLLDHATAHLAPAGRVTVIPPMWDDVTEGGHA